MIARPYIVCDDCGHTWMCPEEMPPRCENCGSRNLYDFATIEDAEDHSEGVLDALDDLGEIE